MPSVLIRIDQEFNKWLKEYSRNLKRAVGEKLNTPEVTKILSSALTKPLILKNGKLVGTTIIIDGGKINPLVTPLNLRKKKKKISMEYPLYLK